VRPRLANSELTLVRCAAGVLALGLSLPWALSCAFELIMLLWEIVPEKGTLIGDTGYLGPLFQNARRLLLASSTVVFLSQSLLSLGGAVLGWALVRPAPWASALLRRVANE
jgi:hypothetical protein